MNSTFVRRVSRATAVAAGVALTSVASPALAAPPTTWDDSDNGSALSALLLLGGVPLLVIAAIVLLVTLPSMMRSGSGSSETGFQEKPEWFGGPRQGADAARTAEPDDAERGGAGAGW